MDDFSGTVCGNNVKYPLIGAMREELRGVSRGKDAKDIDWEKVAASFDDTAVRYPFLIVCNSSNCCFFRRNLNRFKSMCLSSCQKFKSRKRNITRK